MKFIKNVNAQLSNGRGVVIVVKYSEELEGDEIQAMIAATVAEEVAYLNYLGEEELSRVMGDEHGTHQTQSGSQVSQAAKEND